MVVTGVPEDLVGTLADTDGYLGFGLITQNGIPKIIDMRKKLKVQKEDMFSTMCATIIGASSVLADIISPQSEDMCCICVHFGNYQIILANCKAKELLLFVAVDGVCQLENTKDIVQEMAGKIDDAKLIL